MAITNSVTPQDRDYPFDRTNLKVRRQFAVADLVYEGWAAPGALETDEVWQIANFTVDAQAPPNVLTKNYPQNLAGQESNAFAFAWSARASLNYGA